MQLKLDVNLHPIFCAYLCRATSDLLTICQYIAHIELIAFVLQRIMIIQTVLCILYYLVIIFH